MNMIAQIPLFQFPTVLFRHLVVSLKWLEYTNMTDGLTHQLTAITAPMHSVTVT